MSLISRNACLFVVVISIAAPVAWTQNQQQPEITVGAQAWAYERVYPLLDGLFQDTASTQIANLTLNPNTSNAAQLDAVVQSLQIQAGYNQLSGVQNSVAAQSAVENLGYQATLTQQEQSILQQQLSAQQQLAQDQQNLTTATASGNAAQIATANQAVNAETATVNGLAGEMSLLKSGPAASPATPATGSIAPPLTNFTSAVPSSIGGSGMQSGGASFPATKQMDNQMDLLWSRLARVVGTMSRPDSMDPDDRMYLIEFDTGTFPHSNRKKHILDTRYDLACTDHPELQPTVVDTFPRVAALNVTNTNYKDASINLGAALAFFGLGLNGGYNREHLRLSQTLGQSSYITGYGVGQSVFGWKFGIPLGDQIISSDIKRTFALVRIPAACGKPSLQLTGVGWAKPGDSVRFITADAAGFPSRERLRSLEVVSDTMGEHNNPSSQARPHVLSIDFNRATYDPDPSKVPAAAVVTITVTLDSPIDQQAELYANGTLLKRARDTFGRAIPLGSGSNGLLEESTAVGQINTWMPISPKSLVINLDGVAARGSFPTINILAPGKPSFVVSGIATDTHESVTVSGSSFHCSEYPCSLPSLAYPATRLANIARVGVAPWRITDTGADLTTPDRYKLVFTIIDADASNATQSNTDSSVQLVTGSAKNIWGQNPEVYVMGEDGETRLHCDPDISYGQRLVCSIPAPYLLVGRENSEFELKFHIIDPWHPGKPVEAWPVIKGCAGNCTSPVAWDVTNPTWVDSAGGWKFWLQFINVDPGVRVALTNSQDTPVFPSSSAASPDPRTRNFTCNPNNDDSNSHICTATFIIRPEELAVWHDHMYVHIENRPTITWQMLNVKSLVNPTVLTMSPDFTTWTGTNLSDKFSSMKIGIAGPAVAIECSGMTTCVVTGSFKKLKPASPLGFLYLQEGNTASKPRAGKKTPKGTVNSQPIPPVALLRLNADGKTTSPILFRAQSSGNSAGGKAGTTIIAKKIVNKSPALAAANPPAPITASTPPVDLRYVILQGPMPTQ